MRILLTLLALLPAIANVDAAPARLSRPADELRLVFLDADDRAPVRQSANDDATIDVGRVVATRCPSRGCMRTIVKKRFRLRIDGRGIARFARTQAFVQGDASDRRVRIDGRLLTSAPLVIDPAIPVGVAVVHTLEIEVPVSEPEGLLAENIVWLVEDVR